jgi:hypothetical protein
MTALSVRIVMRTTGHHLSFFAITGNSFWEFSPELFPAQICQNLYLPKAIAALFALQDSGEQAHLSGKMAQQ